MIAENDLDWDKLGPRVGQYRALIAEEVKADTRKLSSYDDFERVTGRTTPAAATAKSARGPGGFGLRALGLQLGFQDLALGDVTGDVEHPRDLAGEGVEDGDGLGLEPAPLAVGVGAER